MKKIADFVTLEIETAQNTMVEHPTREVEIHPGYDEERLNPNSTHHSQHTG